MKPAVAFVVALLAIALLPLFLTMPAVAQDENLCDTLPTITYGTELTGEITNVESALGYCFEVEANDQLTITMEATGGNLDPLLALLNAETSEAVATNDDIEQGNTNARITYTSFQPGTLVIFATRYQAEAGTTTGSFRLTLERGIDETERAASTGENACERNDFPIVEYGEPISGTVTNETPAVTFCFQAETGDALSFATEVTSGDLQPVQVLLEPFTGETLATSAPDDTGQTSSMTYTVQQDGALLISVARLNGDAGTTTGDFNLTVQEVEGAKGDSELEQSCEDNGFNTIAYGETVDGTLESDVPAVVYCLEVQAGDTLTFTTQATSGDFQPTQVVLEPFTNEVLETSMPDASGRANTMDYVVEETGLLIVGVSRLAGSAGATSGAFSLTVEAEEARAGLQPTAAMCQDAGTVAYGETVTGTINGNGTSDEGWCFVAEAGDTVEILMEAQSNNLDTLLALLDAETGDTLVSNDDYDMTTTDSFITYDMEEAGDYLIVATRYQGAEGTTSGDYQLSLDRLADDAPGQVDATDPCNRDGAFPVLTVPSVNREITDRTHTYAWCVELLPNTAYTMSAQATGGDLDAVVLLLDPATNEIIASNDDANPNTLNASLTYTTDADGEAVILAVSRYNGQDGDTTGTFEMRISEE